MAASFPILVVDDDPNTVHMLNRAADSTFPQAQFIAIYTFREAVAYLDGLRGIGPRLILLDINLRSEQSGLDFLSLLRQHPQGRLVPTVLFTSDPNHHEEAYTRGANAYTLKPDTFEDWKHYVHQLGLYWFTIVTLPKLYFKNQSG